MTEKEKMVRQMLYDANYDKALLEERLDAKELCYDYNQLRPRAMVQQQAVLKRLLGRMGENVCILAPFWCDYGYNIKIGKNFFANHGLTILDPAPVTFGDNVFIGSDCGFSTAGHPVDAERRNRGLEYAWPITVGDNVWIGAGVQVMPGVTIGSNVVIGGGSVVVKDIPDNSVAVGNPCHVIRPITDEDKKKTYDRNPAGNDSETEASSAAAKESSREAYDQTAKQIAAEMLMRGLSLSAIQSVTNLPYDVLRELKNQYAAFFDEEPEEEKNPFELPPAW